MKDQVMFIGGPADGREVAVDRGVPIWRVVERGEPRVGNLINETVPATEIAFTHCDYERHRLRGGQTNFSVFTPVGWDGEKLMRTLLGGYGAHAQRVEELEKAVTSLRCAVVNLKHCAQIHANCPLCDAASRMNNAEALKLADAALKLAKSP